MSPKPAPEFHFDFGSPNAYLAHRVLPSIEARTGIRFDYVPVLLGGVFKATNNRSPGEAFAGIRNKPEYERRQMQRFIAKHGLTEFRFNPHFPVNTLQVMRGAVAARQDGILPAYVDAVFRAMWEQGRKMDDPATIEATFTEAGLPTARLLARMAEPEIKAALITNTEASVARGNFGSPSFFVGAEMWFGKDTLRDVEEAITTS